MSSPYESVKRGAGGLLQGALGALLLVGGMVVAMWAVEVFDYVTPGDLDAELGIISWSPDGLIGILFAPFLHANFEHLMANSLPLLVLGFLAAFRGIGKFLWATLIIMVVGGVGTWFATLPGIATVGASGLVFGYFGFVVARGLFDRRALDILVGLGVAVAYYSLIWGLLPTQEGISWQGHLFGLIGGVVAAWVLRRKRLATPTYPAY
ncbi:rhomboid family intramembrane serine protease [Nonomuraea africana]|uniref:Membrane associated rhomboid family serine protease n=1 Tax=Nonomuraea africana TaxID=46171 RepID=A0ABR9KTF1_9ACTN|nr:rhomboid family intramembrane serine protease [Nonomuraea africana]MBE1565313.1 membrane associated rhomboid family serine protease [Nonomuraea africana]